ncbi:MAG: glycosyltransferase family 39 protein [Anaerolineales bacterium]|nr:glycosyltransferase family 39 protein [Anaerolineales bacterium]
MDLRHWFTSKKSFPLRIFLVALVLRLVPVGLAINLGIGLDDMFQYDMLARSIVAGDGFRWYAQEDLDLVEGYVEFDLSTVDYDPRGVPTSFRPPLYPTFLALIYFVTGTGAKRFFIARLVQTLVSAALVPLTYGLAQCFFPANERTARIAAWVIAVYPMLVLYPLSLATENLFFVLILGALLVLLKAAEKRTWKWFALGGLLLGLAALTRSVSLALAGLAVLWVWFALRERKFAVLVFLMVTLVTLPWMVRNTLLHGRLTGVESALGYDLYLGYHPAGTGTFQYPQSLDLIPMLDDGLRDEIGRAKTWEFIQADPGRVPYLFVRRAGHFFGLERRVWTYFYSNNFFGYIPAPQLLTIAAVLLLPFVVVSTSACFGLALTRWRTKTWLLALFLVGYITPHLLIIAEDRFHLTTVPFLAILAAQFWTAGRAAVRQRWTGSPLGRLAVILALVGVVLLLSNWGLELWRDADKLAVLLGPDGNQMYLSY